MFDRTRVRHQFGCQLLHKLDEGESLFVFHLQSFTMSSTKRQRPHQKEVGTERCVHTCPESRCLNLHGSRDWNKEGSSLGRHQKSKFVHPKCTAECPGFSLLKDKKNHHGKRQSTQTTPSWGSNNVDGMDVDVPVPGPSNTADDDVEMAEPSRSLTGTCNSIKWLYIY